MTRRLMESHWNTSRNAHSTRRKPRRLFGEMLEDRRVLASFIVNSLDDTADANPGDGIAADVLGNTTLRAALEEANALAGLDSVSIAVSGDIFLTRGQLAISDGVVVAGPGADQLSIDAQGNSRVLGVIGANVTLDAVTITGGADSGDGGGISATASTVLINDSVISGNSGLNGGGVSLDGGSLTIIDSTISVNSAVINGGGIHGDGAITIIDSTISRNSAVEQAHLGIGSGGGVSLEGGSLTIIDSTIANNLSRDGGGIWTYSGGGAVIGSTITGNTAFSRGGGFGNDFFNGPFTIRESMISGNSATFGGGVWGMTRIEFSTITDNSAYRYDYGDGVLVQHGRTEVVSSIIAGNNPENFGGGDVRTSGMGSFLSLGYNIVGGGNGEGAFSQLGDQTGVTNPMLAALADNGGPTLTHALLPGSPALDTGNPNAVAGMGGVPLLDQRGAGFRRVSKGRIDIGAFELQQPVLTVDTLQDESDGDFSMGDLSLREALEIANTELGANTINFADDLAGSIDLFYGQLTISDEVTITGPGVRQLTINATGSSRVFSIDDGPAEISGLTLTGGNSSYGGGIRNDGAAVTISDVAISGNTASFGGAIFNNRGTVTLLRSTVSSNSAAGNGGGIWSDTNLSGTQTLTVTNSTISGNTAEFNGGGIFNYSGLTVVEHSTVTQNQANMSGDGVWSYGDSGTRTEIRSSIVAGNAGAQDLHFNSYDNSFLSLGYNVVGSGNGAASFTGNGDQIIGGADPGLAALDDNGGPTQTHALLPGSPALDAGDPAAMAGVGGVPLFDQRGAPFARVFDGNAIPEARIDIGAFELQPTGLACDFDGDGSCDINDLDLFYLELGGTDPVYDLDGSALVDNDDLTEWLGLASAADALGRTFVRGDADLDGSVLGNDFTQLAANFGGPGGWAQGNFVVDAIPGGGDVVGSDFTQLAANFGFASPLQLVVASSSHSRPRRDAIRFDWQTVQASREPLVPLLVISTGDEEEDDPRGRRH